MTSRITLSVSLAVPRACGHRERIVFPIAVSFDAYRRAAAEPCAGCRPHLLTPRPGAHIRYTSNGTAGPPRPPIERGEC